MEEFKEVLKDLIQQTGLSLRKLADECGVSAVQLGKYKKGAFPNIEIAVKLANYFECSLDYLFGLTDKNIFKGKRECNFTNFVDRYQKIIDNNKTTHYKFAKLSNLSESCLRHWKYGQIPKTTSLLTIAKYFDVSIDYLVGRTDKI